MTDFTDFTWQVLVVCLASLAVATIYFFYFNRLLAVAVSRGIRLITWFHSGKDKIYVNIGSLTVSPLTGAVVLKDFAYHSSNQSIEICQISVIWRYWLLRTRQLEWFARRAADTTPDTDAKDSSGYACRVHIVIHGIDWCMYNRTAAYDDLAAKFAGGSEDPTQQSLAEKVDVRVTTSGGLEDTSVSNRRLNIRLPQSILRGSTRLSMFLRSRLFSWIAVFIPVIDFKDFLPISFEASKAALSVGNHSTPSLLVGQFHRASGTYSISNSASPLDLYRQIISAKGTDCRLFLKSNPRYRRAMTEDGQNVTSTAEKTPENGSPGLDFDSFWQKYVDSREPVADRMTRSKKNAADPLEYAREEKIFESTSLDITYVTDIPGIVPLTNESQTVHDHPSPEWSMDVVIDRGILRYGPWADRQRAELQRAFFPPVYRDSVPTTKPRVGEDRQFTAFKIVVESANDLSIQVPFREASKNWMFDERKVQLPIGGRRRSPVSLQLKCGGGSALRYIMPMVADTSGYCAKLDVLLKGTGLTTSSNDIRLSEPTDIRIGAEMPSPLLWNASRTWRFDIVLESPILRLVRDHITLLTDLGKDWSSGPPSDFHRWVPIVYIVQLALRDFTLHTFLNDHNIIDYPQVFDENAMFTLRGNTIRADARIDSDKFRPEFSIVPFAVETSSIEAALIMPKWDTRAVFACNRSTDVGRTGKIRVDGSFRYFSEVHEEFVDTLTLNLQVDCLALKTFGWLIRRLMVLRDNYFGSFTHFSTSNEYRAKHSRGQTGDPVVHKDINTFEVVLEATIREACFAFPAGLAGFEELTTKEEESHELGLTTLACAAEMQVSFRLHDLGMDLSLGLPPLRLDVLESCNELEFFAFKMTNQSPQVIIEGVDIVAHRLFGPKPETATYFCVWEISLGAINGSLSLIRLHQLVIAISAFTSNFKDTMNSPTPEYEIMADPDVTSLKINIRSLHLFIPGASAAFKISLSRGMRMLSRDLPSQYCSKLTSYRVHDLSIQAFLKSPSASNLWLEVAYMSSHLAATRMLVSSGSKARAQRQVRFLREQDSPTRRVSALLSGNTDTAMRHVAELSVYLPPLDVDIGYGVGLALIPEASQMGSDADATDDDILADEARDARLAQQAKSANFSYRHHNPYGDDSFSSGEESGGNDSESEADCDSADDRDGPNDDSPLGLYPAYLSAYRITVDRRGAMLLSKSKDNRNPVKSYNAGSASPHMPPIPNVKSLVLSDCLEGTNTLQISVKSPEFFITPLAIDAAHSMLQEYTEFKPSPELLVDSLLSLLASTAAEEALAKPLASTEINIENLKVSFFHCRRQAQGSPSKTENANSRVPQTGILQLSVRQMSVGFGHHRIESPTPHNYLRMDAPKATLTLGEISNHAYSQESKVAPHSSLRLTLERMLFSSSQHHYSGSASLVDIGLNVSAILHTIAHAESFIPPISKLNGLLRKFYRERVEYKRYLLWDVLHKSREKAIQNPLSLVKGSLLVSSHKLRTGVSYNMLTYLRLCLAALSSVERLESVSVPASRVGTILLTDVEHLVRRRWGEWTNDVEGAESVDLPLLNALYERSTKKPSKRSINTLRGIELSLRSICIQDVSQPSMQSKLNVGSLSFLLTWQRKQSSLAMGTTVDESTPPGSSSYFTTHTHFAASLIVSRLVLHVFPQFLQLLQEGFRAHKLVTLPPTQEKLILSKRPYSHPRPMSLDFLLGVERFQVRASAQNLLVDTGASGLHLTASGRLLPSRSGAPQRGESQLSANSTWNAREFFVRARSANRAFQSDDSDILASVLWKSCKFTGALSQQYDQQLDLYGLVDVSDVLVSVPRSATRTYQFIEEWRADYLPAFHGMVRSLLKEMKPSNRRPSVPAPRGRQGSFTPTVSLDFRVSRFGIVLQITHGVWLSWEVLRILICLHTSKSSDGKPVISGELRVDGQLFHVGSTQTKSPPSSGGQKQPTGIKLGLPAFTFAGQYGGSRLRATAQLDYFRLFLKPQYFDDILLVHHNVGNNYYELIELIAANRRGRTIQRTTELTTKDTPRLLYSVVFTLKGFLIGVKGPTSTQFIECSNIIGSASHLPKTELRFKMKEFTLSLSPSIIQPNASRRPDPTKRSAFISVDMNLDIDGKVASGAVTKLHAVMSPASIGEFGDLFDYVQMEMRNRQEQRATELAEIRSKTKKFLQTFEEDVPSIPTSSSWLSKRTVKLQIVNFGVAFPLQGEPSLVKNAAPVSGTGAFLLSISTVSFEGRKLASGTAKMENLMFQFIHRFDQTKEADFNGLTQESNNQLIYPELSAILRSDVDTKIGLRKLKIGASISGFILHVDPAVVDYVYALIEVYRRGKERIDNLALLVDIQNQEANSPETTSSSLQTSTLLTSNILISLHFLSGTVTFHANRAASVASSPRSLQDQIKLPSLSVWAEYRATPLSQKLGSIDASDSSLLTFKSLIHSSHNVLRPTLLQFLTQVIHAVDVQLNHVRSQGHLGDRFAERKTAVKDEGSTVESIQSMQISFGVQIDKSQLDLTCLPDVNVKSSLQWDSGGFVAIISPGAKQFSLTGVVGGLRATLEHGYLHDERCAEIDARNLTFSMAFVNLKEENSQAIQSMSIVVDTELSASLRLLRLQDILCFRAVWLDRIPILTKTPESATKDTQEESIAIRNEFGRDNASGFVTSFLLRARRMRLAFDMGSDITNVSLDLRSLAFRTLLTEEDSDIELSIASITLGFELALAGSATTPNFSFHTVRRRHGLPIMDRGKAKTLQMTLTSGTLDILLSSEGRRILHYHAEPVFVVVHDDLSQMSGKTLGSPSHLGLNFSVAGGEIIAMATIGTIPRLMSLANKVQVVLSEQRENAIQESQAFRTVQSLKPNNPLTAVANAMIQSAKTRFNDNDAGLGYIMAQHISLRLQKLQLAIFYRNVFDTEVAFFTGIDIHAELEHVSDSRGVPLNNQLHLSLTSISIAKLGGLNHALAFKIEGSEETQKTVPQWLAGLLKDSNEATIFKLPALDIQMNSSDKAVASSDKATLEYDFCSLFPQPVPGKDIDTEITLNISLYKWLAEFRSRLAVELALVSQKHDLAEARQTGDAPSSVNDNPLLSETDGLKVENTETSALRLPSLTPPRSGSRSRAASDVSPPDRTTSTASFDYIARSRRIARPTIRQLGDATPDILHPFFSKRAGFSVEEELPAYIHEYATVPLEQLMKVLLRLYSRQFKDPQAQKPASSEEMDTPSIAIQSGNVRQGESDAVTPYNSPRSYQ